MALALAAARRETSAPEPVDSGKFAAQAGAFLDTVEPEAGTKDAGPIELALHALEGNYQLLKSGLLEVGAQGQLPVAEMDARLRAASIMRRAMQQATKAARLLGGKTSAVATPPENGKTPS